MNAPNPERFGGDKKGYKLWKTALQSEVEHIEMTSDMWLRLLAARTKLYANAIVTENKEAQEILGSQATVEQIWNTFEKRYAGDRTPGQDFLQRLMSGTAVKVSDPRSLWSFIDQCTMAAKAMERDEVVRITLTVPHNREAIAKRLGEKEFAEWKVYWK